MNIKISLMAGAVMCAAMLFPGDVYALFPWEQEQWEPDNTVRVYDKTVFYDGYQDKIVYDADLDDGIRRFTNFRYSRPLTDAQLEQVGDKLTVKAVIGALCDNYDRMGTLSVAFVPKGAADYQWADVERIEVARFITPFMNKNRTPNEVPFEWEVPALALVLRNEALRRKYDFWLEAEVFGIPYAANTQIEGCADRNDTFSLTVDLCSDNFSRKELADQSFVVPVFRSQSEIHGDINFNNHNVSATDTLGVATRTFLMNIPADCTDSRLNLIMTNHGATENGEEYIRRLHLVYVDGEIVLTYTPGGESCEPYRRYNTQLNGIYAYSRPLSFWQETSNWCPGEAVPVREIHTGALKAGVHKVMIRVPDAEFADGQGDFRPSLYLVGVKEGTVPAGMEGIAGEQADVAWSREGDILHYTSGSQLVDLGVFALDGQRLWGEHNPAGELDLSLFDNGAYVVVVTDSFGRTAFTKLLK